MKNRTRSLTTLKAGLAGRAKAVLAALPVALLLCVATAFAAMPPEQPADPAAPTVTAEAPSPASPTPAETVETPAPATPAAPARDAARIQADGRFTYDGATKTVIADGHVRVTYKGVTITADKLRADLDKNLVFAEGNVVYAKDDDKVEAASMTYDLKAEKGEFSRVRTQYTQDNIKGKVFVTGEEMANSPDVLKLVNGSLTTCDLADPHYHLETSELTIYVDDRIVARKVAYYEGKHRLFTLPYLVLPLKKDNQFQLPQIGYSSTDGWFIKTTYNYYRNSHSYGSYFLDWYQLRGLGLGARHNFDFGAKDSPTYGNGSGFLYARQNRDDDPDLYTRLSYDQKYNGGWTSSIASQYDVVHPDPLQDEVTANSNVRVSRQAQRGRTDVNLSYRTSYIDTRTSAYGEPVTQQVDLRDVRASLNTSSKIGETWNYSIATSFAQYAQVGKTSYDTMGYQVQATGDVGHDLLLRVNAQGQFTPPPVTEDDDDTEQVKWKSYHRLPELSLETKRITIKDKPAPLQAVLTYGRYVETNDDQTGTIEASRGDLTVRLTGLNYTLTPRVSANVTGSSSASYYSNGDYRISAAAGTGVTYRPSEGWTTNLRYNWQDGLGAYSFYSLTAASQENVTGSVQYARNGITADLSSGYNLLTAAYYDLNARLGVARGKFSATASAGYDLNNQAWHTVTSTVQYKPSEELQIGLGVAYDFRTGELQRGDAQIGLPLTKLWRLDVLGSWDGFNNELYRGEVALTRDLHCREIKLRYDEIKRETWLELRIKAFPTQGFRFGAGQDRLMFDPQGLGDVFSNNVDTNPSVR